MLPSHPVNLRQKVMAHTPTIGIHPRARGFRHSFARSFISAPTLPVRAAPRLLSGYLPFLLVAEWVSTDIRVTSPDLLVSIDYGKLGISVKDHLSIPETAFIFMGFTNETSLVNRTSYALPAISRTHNLATVHYKGRQVIETNSVSVGILPVSVTLSNRYVYFNMFESYTVIRNLFVCGSQSVHQYKPFYQRMDF